MTKTRNRFGHMVLTSGEGMTLTYGTIYTKNYITIENIDDSAWTEVPDSQVPPDDEITAEEALNIIAGGDGL